MRLSLKILEINMKEAIILHGILDSKEYFEEDFPSPSNAHWLPWLQQKFLRNGVLCQCIEMPRPFEDKPSYEEWKNLFERFVSPKLSTVIGHSAGCGFFLKWLHNNQNVKLDKLVLVAPFIDPFEKRGDFLKFDLDKNALRNVKEVHLFISNDDKAAMIESTRKIIEKYHSIVVHRYADLRHFCFRNTGPTFEDLWDVCK